MARTRDVARSEHRVTLSRRRATASVPGYAHAAETVGAQRNTVSLSDHAMHRLQGQWGGYENEIKRVAHFPTTMSLVSRFLVRHAHGWQLGLDPADAEFLANQRDVRQLLTAWAERKLQELYASGTDAVLKESILFKQLHYGNRATLNFGSAGVNWKKRDAIADELRLYRPWSIAHFVACDGENEALPHARLLVEEHGSPAQLAIFDCWATIVETRDRPMLFPQVLGATGEKFFRELPGGHAAPVIFDFGIVNVARGRKILIEVGSGIRDEDRWRIPERSGWLVLGFSEEFAQDHPDACLAQLGNALHYPEE